MSLLLRISIVFLLSLGLVYAKGNSSFNCSKKTCKRMVSCSEAHYKWKQCGISRLDRDKDGIPCENKCGKTKSAMQRKLEKGR